MFSNLNFKNLFQISNFKFQIVFLLLATSYLLLATVKASAFTMSNTNYTIQMGNFNSFSGNKSNSSYKLSDTGGELGPGLYSGTNYKVRAGFQYIHSIITFSFKISGISATFIDFGSLDANSPVDRTNTLTISNGSANGYQVTASENHQLLSPSSGQLIPNTTCDNGLCTDVTSGPWVVSGGSSTTYGFGYRCDNVSGIDCATGFTTSTFFKQFSINPNSRAVMTGANVGRSKQVKITYRVNVSGTQSAGQYSNIITYVATPTF